MNLNFGLALLGAVALTPMMVAPAEAEVHRFHEDHVLGTSFDMVVVGADAMVSAHAMRAARVEIDRLDSVLSGWRDDSELAALNRTSGPFPASKDLFQVIAACEAWRTECGGAFSARIGAVEAAWREGQAVGRVPAPDDLANLALAAEHAPVRLDPETRVIDRQGVRFAVDAFAKGYIIDAALDAARKAVPAAKGLMVDIGGDVACQGLGPGGADWRIGIAGGGSAENAAPQSIVTMTSGAVATSGVGARDRFIDGYRYAHIVAPDSGRAASHRLVTVTAPTAGEADALSTAIAAVSPDRGLAMVTARTGTEARIVDAHGVVFASAGWSSEPPILQKAVFQAPKPKPSAAPAAAWPPGFEVTINYEIPVQPYRAKTPFVVLFITNESGDLVRTIAHMGNRPPRYLDSNYTWYRAFTAKNGDIATVTRPSRQSGQYSATWDGKDDAGNPVARGKYTINIEISREHGGHSLQSIPLTLGAMPVSGDAGGQPEAGPASAHYGKAG